MELPRKGEGGIFKDKAIINPYWNDGFPKGAKVQTEAPEQTQAKMIII